MVNGKDEWGEAFFTFDDLKQTNRIPFSCIYRKKVWEEIGGYKNFPFNDWFFWLCAMKKQYNFFYNPDPIYNFRQEGNSLSNREFNAQDFSKTREQLLSELEKFNG